ATIDVKDMLFMIPIQPEAMDCFAFMWEGQQYTFTRLPQGYKHSPTLAFQVEWGFPISGLSVHIWQQGPDGPTRPVICFSGRYSTKKIISHLESLNLQFSSEKTQKPPQEVKCLGIWWKGGMACILPDTLTSLDLVKMPESRKDLQQALGLLVFWRKHIPDFSITVRPLYELLRKGLKWDWTPSQEEGLQLLIFAAVSHGIMEGFVLGGTSEP
ncbi:TF29 protein, partial [Cinclus mexicanus]|nr:TF29 protein [Cinclus mexicanus]